LNENMVMQIVEYAPGKLACGIWGEPFVALVTRGDTKSQKLRYPNKDETQCTDLIPVPNFDYKLNPYLLLRNCKSINLVDIKNFKVSRLLSSPNQKGSFPKMRLV